MHKNINIVMAQQNFWVGDIAGNTTKIINAATQARDELQADVIVFPELALCGYPPEDLLLRPDFHKQIVQALEQLKQTMSGIDIVVGHPHRDSNGKIYNAASVIRDHKIIACYQKQCLPNYGVFDEKRYFQTGNTPVLFTVKEVPIGIVICEDLWHREPAAHTVQAGAKLIVCLNASPFDMNKFDERLDVLRARISENRVPVIYVHGVGSQDELIFDGGSLAMNAEGKIKVQAKFYEEELIPINVEVKEKLQITPVPLNKELSIEEHVYQALVLSVRDYVEKNNFPGVLIGLSGGIDSALTLAIAVDALGKDRVHAVSLPSQFTSDLSVQLAEEMAAILQVKLSTISIEANVQTFLSSLKEEFAGLAVDKTEENIQARCRGVIMMALSNKTGKLVLTTGNKSEMAVGYATLYGDMAGGFAVLKDVFKTWVYRLANYRNAISLVIPQAIIDRAPTAELAHNQTDQDTLPPYAELDHILKMYVEEDCSVAEIIDTGFTKETVCKVVEMVDKSEYKRRQAPIGPRVTRRAFGRERRYPLTSKYKAN